MILYSAIIEGTSYFTNYNVCSGYSHIVSILKRDAILSKLIELCKTNEDYYKFIQRRFMYLLGVETDPVYESRYDIAFLCYLYVLNEVDIFSSKMYAQMLFENIPNCFWARRIARNILGVKFFGES